jgi:acetylglutamate kinase
LAKKYEVTLIYSFEKKGVLSNPDDDDSVIPLITREIFKMYEKNGVISGGMKPKVENALSAVESGVSRVVITLADNIGKSNEGTVIQ